MTARDAEFVRLWRQYLSAGKTRRKLLLGRLLAEKEGLAQKAAQKYLTKSQYHLAPYRDDIMQAARLGLIRAFDAWEPDRGAFSTIAYFWIRHEIQQVIKHVTPITRTRSADLPRHRQDAAAAFYAREGREPAPSEIGVSESAARCARLASATFEGLEGVSGSCDDGPPESAEGALDRRRQAAIVAEFVGGLSEKNQRRFWDGDTMLVALAKQYVEERS